MKVLTLFAVLVVATACTSAYCDSFGSGANSFDIEFVTIGNPGNSADLTGNPNPSGSVAAQYRIAKFEMSRGSVEKAIAEGLLDITLQPNFGPNVAEQPAVGVTWLEAASLVNWLNTTSGYLPAYKFEAQGENVLWQPTDLGYNSANPYRNSLAKYFLPTMDEWYKAAYYNPSTDTYFDYTTASNIAPTAVGSGTAAGTAVYGQPPFEPGPAIVTQAGGLGPNGTMGQGGNVWEWIESDPQFSYTRLIRGGNWVNGVSNLFAGDLEEVRLYPTFENFDVGFRIGSAAIPEPSALILLTFGSFGAIVRYRRRSMRLNRIEPCASR